MFADVASAVNTVCFFIPADPICGGGVPSHGEHPAGYTDLSTAPGACGSSPFYHDAVVPDADSGD
eukprot:16140733-Heterocapsa_arctica.AAC.1